MIGDIVRKNLFRNHFPPTASFRLTFCENWVNLCPSSLLKNPPGEGTGPTNP
jgi:hypothetical protein